MLNQKVLNVTVVKVWRLELDPTGMYLLQVSDMLQEMQALHDVCSRGSLFLNV